MIGFVFVDADGHFERRVRGTAAGWDIDVNVHDMSTVIGGVGIADSAQHAFDDVDVMLSAIQVAHEH